MKKDNNYSFSSNLWNENETFEVQPVKDESFKISANAIIDSVKNVHYDDKSIVFAVIIYIQILMGVQHCGQNNVLNK